MPTICGDAVMAEADRPEFIDVPGFDTLLKIARELKTGNAAALLAEAAAAGLSDAQAEALIEAAHGATGVSIEDLQREWVKALTGVVNARRVAGASARRHDSDEAEPARARGDEAAMDALVQATELYPGAPFASDNVCRLAALKRGNRAKFETLRTRLKKAGCRVTELDRLIARESGEEKDRKPSQADVLVSLAEEAELFQSPDEEAYADIEVSGHRETWSVTSRGFRRWLKRRFYEETGGAPSAEPVASAIGVIEAKALYDTERRPVHVRVGELDGKIYVDRCDPKWRVVEADKTGWRIVDRPEIRFRRTSDMRALPEPVKGGSIADLRPLLNIRDDADGNNDFVLAVAFVLACLRGRGPYPIMVVTGEQGTAKSTRSAMLRSIVDPSKPRLRSLPRDERDLVIAARSRLMLAFDNVSGLKWWLSDACCRIASGAGFGTRQLYTDADEIVFEGARPQIFNGIEDIVDRPDFAERSIFSVCEVIAGKDRLEEEEIWAAFDEAHPSILGALLDAVVMGLQQFHDTRPPELPRMADFAHWAVACEPALWAPGTFMAAYNANILGAVESVLEANPVAIAVRTLMANQAKWEGTASALLAELTELVGERMAKSEMWPHNGRAMSGRLRRAAAFLRQIDVYIDYTREAHTGSRLIVITRTPSASGAENKSNFASPPSPPSPDETASSKNNGLGVRAGDGRGPAGDDRGPEGDGRSPGGDGWVTMDPSSATAADPLKTQRVAPDGDGGDANLHPLSAPENEGIVGAAWRRGPRGSR